MLRVVLELAEKRAKFDLLAVLFLHQPVGSVPFFIHIFGTILRPIADLIMISINQNLLPVIEKRIEYLKINMEVLPAVPNLHLLDVQSAVCP